MIVKEAMHGTTRVSPYDSVAKVAKIMDHKVIGSVLIQENENVIGIATERDILRKVVAAGKSCDELQIREIMNAPLITIDHNSPIEEASFLMSKYKTRRLVVTENEKIVGVITARDIAERIKFSLAKDMRSYSRPDYK